MAKNYNWRLIQSYRSYKLKDICRLFRDKQLHAQTIRGWIKEHNLPSFSDGKAAYIYGAALKQFIKKRQEMKKSPLALHEFRCFPCHANTTPEGNVILSLDETGGSPLATAICSSCGREMTRYIKKSERDDFLKIYPIASPDVRILSDSVCSREKTHLNNEEKTPLCESEKIGHSTALPKAIHTEQEPQQQLNLLDLL